MQDYQKYEVHGNGVEKSTTISNNERLPQESKERLLEANYKRSEKYSGENPDKDSSVASLRPQSCIENYRYMEIHQERDITSRHGLKKKFSEKSYNKSFDGNQKFFDGEVFSEKSVQ